MATARMYWAYDPAAPWRVGERVWFATFDDEDADTRELDGTRAEILEISDDGNTVRVRSDYGPRWHDVYAFVTKQSPSQRRDP